MATVNDLIKAYLAPKGLKMRCSTDNEVAPLLPLIIMDTAYQIFCRNIKPVECRHNMQKWRNEWLRSYDRFNQSFFRCFGSEETDLMCDIMDDFDKHIEHDIFITLIQIENLLKDEPLERQEVLASAILVNVLCQCAEIVWEDTYKTAPREYRMYTDITACRVLIRKWLEGYYGKNKPVIRPNDDRNVTMAVNILCKKLVDFLKKYAEVPEP